MLRITLFGVGCTKHQTLLSRTREALEELVLEQILGESEFQLEEVEDIDLFIAKGIVNIPALALNGQLITKGEVPSTAELKKILAQAAKPQ